MTYLLAGTGFVMLIWALVWIGLNAPASRVVRWLKWIMVAVLVLAVILLLAMGYFRPALVPGMLLFPILFPWRSVRGSPGFGSSSGMPPRHPGGGAMTYKEAAEILGVAPDASEEEIKEAHRKLMAANHPDKGGSPWFASQLNQARDTLLGH